MYFCTWVTIFFYDWRLTCLFVYHHDGTRSGKGEAITNFMQERLSRDDSLSIKFLSLYGTWRFTACWQEPATGSYSEPYESCWHHPSYFIKIRFNVISNLFLCHLSHCFWSYFQTKILYAFLVSPVCTVCTPI